MSDNLELDRVTAPLKEPAKAWRNRWRSTTGFVAECVCGGRHPENKGQKEIWGCKVFASHELAENRAKKRLIERRSTTLHWLGAFPVDAA